MTISLKTLATKSKLRKLKKGREVIIQFDGPADSDSDDDEEEEDYDNIPIASLGGPGEIEGETEGEVSHDTVSYFSLQQFFL